MNVALAGERGAGGVGAVLVEMIAEVAAPDQMAAEIPVGEGHDIYRLVGQKGERDDKTLVALAAGDGAADETLTKKLQDSIVRGAG